MLAEALAAVRVSEGELGIESPERRFGGGFDCDGLLRACAGSALLAAAELAEARGLPRPAVALDGGQLALACVSERHAGVIGRTLAPPFAALSAFAATAEGHIRLHANYPWHRAALVEVLGAEDLAACAGWEAKALEAAVVAAGGCAAAVRTPSAWAAHPQGAWLTAAPLVAWDEERDGRAAPLPEPPPSGRPRPLGPPAGGAAPPLGPPAADAGAPLGPPASGAAPRSGPAGAGAGAPLGPPASGAAPRSGPAGAGAGAPLGPPASGAAPRSGPAGAGAAPLPAAGLRVLDLTRVIAGPVATRTLAALGADVLRLGHPGRPELELHVVDGLVGKRAAVLDLASGDGADRLEQLLEGADVLISGYRPHALERFGLGPDALAARFPHLVDVRLSAWGDDGPWGGRRGFDSLVQAACGIAFLEGTPGALPCQALDHGTGFLAAAAALRGLTRRAHGEAGCGARLTLGATAAWLMRHPVAPGETSLPDAAPHLLELPTPGGERVTAVRPPGTLDGRALSWATANVREDAAPPRW